jgi:hypothetical protein
VETSRRENRHFNRVLFVLVKGSSSEESSELLAMIELKSLILAQIERWRHALHMQVERQRGGNPGGERRTGE